MFVLFLFFYGGGKGAPAVRIGIGSPQCGEIAKGGSGFSHSCFLPGFSDQPGGFRSFSDPHFLFISLISLALFPLVSKPRGKVKNPGKLGKT